MAGIFLSHSSKDKPVVIQLASDLVYSGFPVWLDSWEMETGDSFVKRIFDGIDGSTFLIVALTPNAVASEWVKRELAAALESEKQMGRKLVLPIKLAPCDLPSEIGDRLYADFTQGYLFGLESLESTMRKLGAANVEVPLERELVPLRFTDSLHLQQVPLQARYESLVARLRGGGRLAPEQFLVVPEPGYDLQRRNFTTFLENFGAHPHFSAEREEHFHNRYQWIKKGERALPEGAAAIANGLIEMNETAFFSMACHWFARIIRNELMAMMDEARAFSGDPPTTNAHVARGVLNFDEVAAGFFEVKDVTPCDIFDSKTNSYIRVWIDAGAEAGRWFASNPQVPVELRTFWSATLIHKFVVPQMVTRHYWNDPATPAIWNFNGWMIGAA